MNTTSGGSQMKKKKEQNTLGKTLVEKILDKHKIPYTQLALPWEEDHHVAQLQVDALTTAKEKIYKTLALTGNKTGPIIAVVPLNHQVNYKLLAQASGNKKVGMIPLKDLVATTGYEHGANTPVGIHETHPHFPIFIAELAKDAPTLIVSSGKIGRSVELAPLDLAKLVAGHFASISEPK